MAAFFYAIQILYYGGAATKVSPWVIVFSVSFCGIGGMSYSVLFERSQWPGIEWGRALPPLLTVALLVTLMTQLLQIYAPAFNQRHDRRDHHDDQIAVSSLFRSSWALTG